MKKLQARPTFHFANMLRLRMIQSRMTELPKTYDPEIGRTESGTPAGSIITISRRIRLRQSRLFQL